MMPKGGGNFVIRYLPAWLTHKVPSHFDGNQQQHDAEGDFELAGGEFVRHFDAERSANHGGDAEDGDGG